MVVVAASMATGVVAAVMATGVVAAATGWQFISYQPKRTMRRSQSLDTPYEFV